MIVLDKTAELLRVLDETEGPLGLVPTMGALHEGHLSLVRAAKKENRRTAATIFVNPTQFNDAADFEHYPRTLPRDLEMLEAEGVDLVFAPPPGEVYDAGAQVSVDPGPMASLLCGMTRAGHFRGVLTIVIKLFNLFRPARAYFGQKDYQQFMLISRMVQDLNVQLELRLMPTFREEDGLAMSSRNTRLEAREREQAPLLYKSLLLAQKAIEAGEEDPLKAIEKGMTHLIEHSTFEVDYFSVVNPFTLEDLAVVGPDKPYLLVAAAFLQPVRLIDNILSIPGRKR